MIVAGFGFRASATLDSLRAAYDLACAHHSVAALATAENKAQAAGLIALAEALELAILPIPAATIAQMQTLTQSARVRQHYATGSVAEAAALAAAGPGARLLSPRHISPDRKATCALAIGDQT